MLWTIWLKFHHPSGSRYHPHLHSQPSPLPRVQPFFKTCFLGIHPPPLLGVAAMSCLLSSSSHYNYTSRVSIFTRTLPVCPRAYKRQMPQMVLSWLLVLGSYKSPVTVPSSLCLSRDHLTTLLSQWMVQETCSKSPGQPAGARPSQSVTGQFSGKYQNHIHISLTHQHHIQQCFQQNFSQRYMQKDDFVALSVAE